MSDKEIITLICSIFCCGFIVGGSIAGMIVSTYRDDYWLKKLEYHQLAQWNDRKSQYVPIWEKTAVNTVDTVDDGVQ